MMGGSQAMTDTPTTYQRATGRDSLKPAPSPALRPAPRTAANSTDTHPAANSLDALFQEAAERATRIGRNVPAHLDPFEVEDYLSTAMDQDRRRASS